ncbi:MAG: nuclear transport factor 2 family protein [Burkholderiaceae bacterium]|jgi:hypothetical protein|nr:nuclear transport factor 2 family protein [Burkholderiaceae bacterium]
MIASELSAEDRRALTRLEEAMWREETRFDKAFMEQALAPDFFEFGRSGRTYTRQQILDLPREPIVAQRLLEDLRVRLLDANTAQLTYNSRVCYHDIVESARRSSIWSRSGDTWVLRFHQGTPFAG